MIEKSADERSFARDSDSWQINARSGVSRVAGDLLMCSHGCASSGIIFYSYESARQSHFRDLHAKSCRMKSSGFAPLVTGDEDERTKNLVKCEGEFNNSSTSFVTDAGANTKILTVEVSYRHNKAIFGRVAKLCTPSQIKHRAAEGDKTFFYQIRLKNLSRDNCSAHK